MNIELIQAWVKSLLDANAALTAALAVKLADDGTYPKTPLREDGLNGKGLVLTVWEPDAEQLLNIATTGTAAQEIYVPVLVEENVSVNRAANGTQMTALEALRHVQSALSGKRPSANSPFVLLPIEPPFKNFGKINGVNRIVVNFSITSTISPA